MTDYIYDGTFEGLLCCIHAHYYIDKAASITTADAYQSNILAEVMEVETNEQKAETVYRAIEGKISGGTIRRIYRMFLSGDEKKEIAILNYVRMGFSKERDISTYHGHPVVREAELIEKKVSREVERLSGLIRFSELSGEVLYSQVEPDNDILELIAPHFSDRYKNNPFIIHDLKRKKALISASADWYICEFDDANILNYGEGELKYRRLWKNYFNSIAIKERTNPRCQKAFMPTRYWKHLTEKQ